MPVESMPESRMDGKKLSEKPFIIESGKSSVVIEGMTDGLGSLENEKFLNSSDAGSHYGEPGLTGSSVAEERAGSKSFENSFSSRFQNGTIHEGRKDPGGGLRAPDSSKSLEGGNSLQSSEAEGVFVKLDCDPQDQEIVKGITQSGSYKDENHSRKLSDSAPRSGESNLISSSEAGATMEDFTKGDVTNKAEPESDGKSYDEKSFDDRSRNLLEGRASAVYHINGNPPENSTDFDVASFDSPKARGSIGDKLPEVHRNGETTYRTSDAGASFDGKISEKSFGSGSRHDEHHHRHSRGSGAGIPNPALVERLYNPPHICNHVRCAANDPDYATKQAVPPKKYLVAKKHQYGGVIDKSRRTSSDHDAGSTEGSRRSSCDHDGGSTEKARRTSCDYGRGSSEKSRRTSYDDGKSYALHALTKNGANGGHSTRASADSDKLRAPNTTAGKLRRTSADGVRNHEHSTSSGTPHHRRGKSAPNAGFTPPGPWNSSVALDKKHGGYLSGRSLVIEKKHADHGGWNSSVAIDRKHGDYYYGPWNSSVAIEKNVGERKEKQRTPSKGDLSQSSRRTSNESSITEDRRQKPRRSSITSEVIGTPDSRRLSGRAENPHGSVSGSSEEGRCAPETPPQGAVDYGSPSASVGSNHTDHSISKDAVSWQRSHNSPESSCVTSGNSPSCESLSSVTRSPDPKAGSKARYELPTVASKLPRFSSAFSSPSQSTSTSGSSAPSKPSWNSSTSKGSLIAATPPTVASVANTSILAKNFIAKLKESTKTAAAAAATTSPALPSWNSSITVAPSLLNKSTMEAGVVKAKQTSKARKVVKGAEEEIKEQILRKLKSNNPTSPEDTAAIPPQETAATGPIVPREMAVPIPESSAEKHVDPGSVVSIPSTPTSKLTRYGSMRDGATNIPPPNKLSKTPSIKEKERESKVLGTLKFGKRGRTTWIEETRKNENVSLKKGETAERRLSEEYMTDHTLTTTVPRDIQGGRVKSLVHAFESLKTGPDADHHHSADETVRSEYERELAAELAALPPSP